MQTEMGTCGARAQLLCELPSDGENRRLTGLRLLQHNFQMFGCHSGSTTYESLLIEAKEPSELWGASQDHAKSSMFAHFQAQWGHRPMHVVLESSPM